MRNHHDILLASLSSFLFLGVACDLPPAPVGKDSTGTEDDEDDDGAPVCEGYDPCAGTEGQLALYSGYSCGPEPLGQWFISTSHISCQDALANCLLNESENLDSGLVLHCEWDGWQIHRTDDPQGLCEGAYGPAVACEDLGPSSCEASEDPCAGHEGQLSNFAFLPCDAADHAPFVEAGGTESTCEDALAACAEFMAEHSGPSIACVWNGKPLLFEEQVAGECATLEPC